MMTASKGNIFVLCQQEVSYPLSLMWHGCCSLGVLVLLDFQS